MAHLKKIHNRLNIKFNDVFCGASIDLQKLLKSSFGTSQQVFTKIFLKWILSRTNFNRKSMQSVLFKNFSRQ